MEIKKLSHSLWYEETWLPPRSLPKQCGISRKMDANYTSYLFENQMLEVGEEESRNLSEANQNCCFEYNSK